MTTLAPRKKENGGSRSKTEKKVMQLETII